MYQDIIEARSVIKKFRMMQDHALIVEMEQRINIFWPKKAMMRCQKKGF